MRLVWIALLACPLTLSAQSLFAQDSTPRAPVESVELGELFASAAVSGTPSLSFLQGLERLQAGEVSRDELWVVLDDLSADGVELPPALAKVLEAVDTISVSGEGSGKKVRFEFREEPEPLDLGAGWGRLGRKVSFDMTKTAGGAVELSGFKGFKLSKKHDSWIKVKLKQVRFETQGNAAVAHVDAGSGGKHVIALESAEPQVDSSARQLLATAKPAESATRGMLEALGGVYTDRAIANALNAGAMSIEHANLISDATMKLLAKKGAFLSTQTGFFLAPIPDSFSAAQKARQQEAAEGLGNMMKLAKKYNVNIAFGTDLVGSMESKATELKEFTNRTKWFTPVEILRQATSINGELMALSGPRNPYPGKLGVVEQGALADLLLVDGNPLENIELMADSGKNFVLIMKDGVIYKNTL